MSEPKRKLIDLSTAKEPANSLDPDRDETAQNPNLDPKFAPNQRQELAETENDEVSPGERMIEQTFLRGGR